MKNNFKFLTSAIALLALTSCGVTENTAPSFYKSAYSDGTYFQSAKESKDSDKDVYIALVNVLNKSEETIAIEAKDITLKVSDKEYTCLFFVESSKFESMTVNGVTQSIYYIIETSQTSNVESSEGAMDQLRCAFEVDGGNNPNIFYKGTAVNSLN